MENTTIAQDLCTVKDKAQVLGSLITSLRGQVETGVMSDGIKRDAISLSIVWSEVESGIISIAESIEYLADLSEKNNVPELLYVLKSR